MHVKRTLAIGIAMFVAALQPAAAVTCDEFDDLLAKRAAGDRPAWTSYFDGWASGMRVTLLTANTTMSQQHQVNLYCPKVMDEGLDKDDLVQTYRNAVGKEPWLSGRQTDPLSCLPEVVIITALIKRYPCQ